MATMKPLSTGTLTDVLVTDELSRRPARRADHEAENRALRQLARNMAGRPEALLQNLVDIALELCRAATAGVSLLQRNADGEQEFVWVALAGTYADRIGDRAPAKFCPSGICLERQAAQLFSYPDRFFTNLDRATSSPGFDRATSSPGFDRATSSPGFDRATSSPGFGVCLPPFVETLVVPFPAGSRPMGTIWVTHHDADAQFDSEDVRVLTGLADFTSAALRVASVVPAPGQGSAGQDSGSRASQAGLGSGPRALGSGPSSGADGVVHARHWPASKAQVALELEVMNRLHDFSTRLLGTQKLNATLDEVLHAAIAMLGADRGDIKLFDAAQARLVLAAAQNLDDEYLAQVEFVPLHAATSCARAVARCERVTIEDVRKHPDYQHRLDLCEAAGFRALQSTPLVSRDGRPLGVLSTHCRQPGRASDRELRMLDLYARHAADHIDMLQRQQEVREAAERERQLLNQARLRAQQLQSLTEASTAIASLSTVEAVLRATTDRAREIVPAYQAVTSLLGAPSPDDALQAASLCTDKYPNWRDAEPPPLGSDLDLLVLRTNRPLCLTHAELIDHPAYIHPGPERPPLRGWLAVPLIGRDGRNLGLIQLSDRQVGEFGDSDTALLVQLAQLAAGALENARLYEALREADRRKDEFLAMLSHELRNPLAPLLTALELIGDEHSGTAVRSEAVNVTRRQVLHLSRLVDDLLEMSRITTGKIRLQTARVDANAMVERAVERMQPIIDQKRQQLTVTLAPEPIWLDVDPARLEQVLGNLLDNASKYTPGGGRIWISVEISIGAGAGIAAGVGATEPEQVAFRVRDDGSGIEPELRPRIFDLFTQADKSLDRSEGGLGIGLALARQIVGMSGGSIEVQSEGSGRGSEFTVRLALAAHGSEAGDQPASLARPSRTGPRSAEELGSGSGSCSGLGVDCLRVLVVDDGHDAAQMLAMLLSSWQHEVAVAHDGPSAIAEALRFLPDVVLLDIGLPLMDGYEVARRLRADPRLDQVCLIAITGYGQATDRQRSQAAGFDLHLVKPIDTRELAELLRPA
jgi:signal transduction histidine kinase/putative methionine-R-sulfoxide reductase with GAF domain